ncbi:MAG: RNA-binding protein [Desulfuromonas sp.]|nr:MAG: RNA-binding protein [Desulfuromonas sp.]
MMGKRAERDIFVADIPFETTEAELQQLFELCGRVRMVRILTDDQGKSKGLAFVRMDNDKETREAVNMLDGTHLGERYLRVSIARTKDERAASTAATAEQQEQKKKGKPGKGRK